MVWSAFPALKRWAKFGRPSAPTKPDSFASRQGPRLVLGFAFGREPAHDKLLCQGGEHALGGVDNDSLERLPRAAIRCRVVGIREGRRGQIATDGRVVRLKRSEEHTSELQSRQYI